jgi:mRNA interferase MazF
MAGDLTRGEVRLFRFPAPDKQRPVLVLTRAAALTFLNRITVAPITSTIRGSPTEVVLGVEEGMKHPCAVNLDHVITVPRAGLGRLVGRVSRARLAEVCRALAFAVGCHWDAGERDLESIA